MAQIVPFGLLKIGLDHFPDQFLKGDFGFPAQLFLSFRGIAQKRVNFRGPKISWINSYNFYDSGAPFGGFKASGFGRDLGRDALDGYLETKTVWVGL